MSGTLDHNFCTIKFLFGIVTQQANFVIRTHQCLPWHAIDDLRLVGPIDSGQVFEQTILA